MSNTGKYHSILARGSNGGNFKIFAQFFLQLLFSINRAFAPEMLGGAQFDFVIFYKKINWLGRNVIENNQIIASEFQLRTDMSTNAGIRMSIGRGRNRTESAFRSCANKRASQNAWRNDQFVFRSQRIRIPGHFIV